MDQMRSNACGWRETWGIGHRKPYKVGRVLWDYPHSAMFYTAWASVFSAWNWQWTLEDSYVKAPPGSGRSSRSDSTTGKPDWPRGQPELEVVDSLFSDRDAILDEPMPQGPRSPGAGASGSIIYTSGQPRSSSFQASGPFWGFGLPRDTAIGPGWHVQCLRRASQARKRGEKHGMEAKQLSLGRRTGKHHAR
jgi:hypothetical protein